MSYVPVFAPDANSQWQALNTRFQEVVLDVLDELCLAPPAKQEHIADVLIDEGPIRHFVFVHVTIDKARRIVTLIGTAHCTRARDAALPGE